VEEDGLALEQVVEVPQTFAGLSSACLHLEAEVLEGRVDAGNCPVMAWCASNAVVQRDGKDNIQPIKKRSRGRIDPISALCIARRLALVHEDAPKSVYESRGLLRIEWPGHPLGQR
jgi:phage terminase large subunit-like protein